MTNNGITRSSKGQLAPANEPGLRPEPQSDTSRLCARALCATYMILDFATVERKFQRFVERIVEKETVYYLSNSNGVANSASNDDDETTVLMFWSDRAYAKRAGKVLVEDFVAAEMSLFDFIYRWLPGMTADGVLAGPNWNGDLVGREIDAFQLREIIEEKMSNEMLEFYEQHFRELSRRT